MKLLMTYIVEALAFLLLVTQVIIPALSNLEFFWLFKGEDKKDSYTPLSQKIGTTAKLKSEVKEEAELVLKTSITNKEQADKL